MHQMDVENISAPMIVESYIEFGDTVAVVSTNDTYNNRVAIVLDRQQTVDLIEKLTQLFEL